MKLRLNISTCPNDTFMFDAMIHRRIDTEGLEFDLFMGDIEELNREALQGTPHISKLSYAVVPRVSDRYQVLNSGSALGRGNGPLLVSRHKLYPDELGDVCVAIPGEYTTANRLLSVIFSEISRRRVYLFSDVAEVGLPTGKRGCNWWPISARSGKSGPGCRSRWGRSLCRGSSILR